MKLQVMILAALVVLISGAATGPDGATNLIQAEPTIIGSRNLISGIINPGDRLLHRGYYTKEGAENYHQTQEVKYIGAPATRITYISALAVAGTQSANAWITAGGLNTNNVTIQLRSVKGFGFDFWIEIWGHITSKEEQPCWH